MLWYFFCSFDFDFSASHFFRGDFWEEFFNTGTSFFELRVLITVFFFIAFFSTFVLVDFLIFFFWVKFFCIVHFQIFCQSKIWAARAPSVFYEIIFSYCTIFMTRLHWNFQEVFFKRRRKNGSYSILKNLVPKLKNKFFNSFLRIVQFLFWDISKF